MEDENLEHNSDAFAVHGSPHSAEEALASHKVPVPILYYGDHLRDPNEGLKWKQQQQRNRISQVQSCGNWPLASFIRKNAISFFH